MFSRHKSWAESSASEIPFPDDNIDAMLLVLRIAHLRFRDIPGKNGLSYAHLLALAVVCDKYDLVKLVRPFLDLYEWAEPHRPRSVDDEKWEPSWLFVAWTFGFGESFEPLARHLVKNISLEGEDGCPKLDEDRYVLEEELPLNYLGKLSYFLLVLLIFIVVQKKRVTPVSSGRFSLLLRVDTNLLYTTNPARPPLENPRRHSLRHDTSLLRHPRPYPRGRCLPV